MSLSIGSCSFFQRPGGLNHSFHHFKYCFMICIHACIICSSTYIILITQRILVLSYRNPHIDARVILRLQVPQSGRVSGRSEASCACHQGVLNLSIAFHYMNSMLYFILILVDMGTWKNKLIHYSTSELNIYAALQPPRSQNTRLVWQCKCSQQQGDMNISGPFCYQGLNLK